MHCDGFRLVVILLCHLAWLPASVVVAADNEASAADQTSVAEPTPSAAAPNYTSAGAAERGYQLLTTKAYLPPDFDEQTFAEVWHTWEEPLRSQAAAATPAERRRMAFDRYGLTVRPGDSSGRPQQYVVDAQGNWTMNCLACHQGQVAGQVIPGVANSLFALETLTEETRATKIRLGKKLSRMDIGFLVMPLGTTDGTTNAVNFGVALMAHREPDLSLRNLSAPPPMVHHDHDAPAWWHVHTKQRLYCDGFADKGHRALMQFMLVKENGPEQFRGWEDDFRYVEAWIESLRPPAYPFAIDRPLAEQGAAVFEQHCAECHGTYGERRSYPEKIVPSDEVGTDHVRLDALSAEHRRHYAESWFNNFRRDAVIADPGGYVAPPLDGIWASAPYFHNGSVPTLWHLLHPSERPIVWTRTPMGYDQQKVGLETRTFDDLPDEATATSHRRRQFFDTRLTGKSAAGHPFADTLTESERNALLEYLKTL